MSTQVVQLGEDAKTRRGIPRLRAAALALILVALPAAIVADAASPVNNSTPPAGDGRAPDGQITWIVLSLDTIGCNAFDIGFTTQLSGYSGGPERFSTIVDAGGLRYMNEDAGTPIGGNGLYGWHLYDSSTGGPTTASFPLPPDTPVTVDFGMINGVGGPYVFLHRLTLSKCNGGTIVNDQVLIPNLGVPTLSTVGLAAFAALLLLAVTWALRRRRSA